MGKQVRHAVARSTGATTLARKDGDEWAVECLSHQAATTADSRATAWRTASKPESFCSGCAAIVKGKAERVSGERVAIPTTPTEKKARKGATVKPPAKAAAKVQPKAPARKQSGEGTSA